MDNYLHDIYRHAIKSFRKTYKNSVPKDVTKHVAKLIALIARLSDIGRKEGLLSLEEAAGDIEGSCFESDLLKRGILLVVDGTDEKLVKEIMCNYCLANYKNSLDKLCGYLITRGILAIQNGDNPRVIEEVLCSCLSFDCRKEARKYFEQYNEAYQAEVEKRNLNKYHDIGEYQIQDIETRELCKEFEDNIRLMSDRDIQRFLRDIANDTLLKAMIGLTFDSHAIIFRNMSNRLKNMMIGDYVELFYCSHGRYKANENNIKTAASEALEILRKLRSSYEIMELDLLQLLSDISRNQPRIPSHS